MKITKYITPILATLISVILGIIAYLYEYKIEGIISQYILYTSIIMTILVGLQHIVMLRNISNSENDKTPGISYLLNQDKIYRIFLIYIFILPIISLSFILISYSEYTNYLLLIWTAILGLTLDFNRYIAKRIIIFSSLLNFFEILIKKAKASLYLNHNIYCKWLTKINTTLNQALSHQSQNDIAFMIDQIYLLHNETLEAFLNEKTQPLNKENQTLVSDLCQNYEDIVSYSITHNMHICAEKALHSLRAFMMRTVILFPELNEIPMGCLHKSLNMIYQTNFDMVLVDITCQMLGENSIQLLHHLNIEEKSTVIFYKNLFSFFEYFANKTSDIYEETLAKNILLKAIAPIVQELCQEPISSKLTIPSILKTALGTINHHIKAKYVQRDPELYSHLLKLQQDIEITSCDL